MSTMWGWFGGNAAQKRKEMPKSAILGLRSQLEMLSKRQKHLQNQIDEQDATARKNVSTNKTAAKAALRRKKTLEKSMDQTNSQMETLEQQINSIESATINQRTVEAMQQAGKAMKQIHGNLNPESVDTIMDELREQNAISEEISVAMANANEPLDDEELEAELEELEQEHLDNKILTTGNVPVLDAVHKIPSPSHVEPVSNNRNQTEEEDEEEAEFRKLQAEMAI